MTQNNVKEVLFTQLDKNGLTVVSCFEKMVLLGEDYLIEIENENLFKLKQGSLVIAPFDDIHEMCLFIKKDIELNEKS